jgi:hypothetical protein
MRDQFEFNEITEPFFKDVFETITNRGVYRVMFEHWHSTVEEAFEACCSSSAKEFTSKKCFDIDVNDEFIEEFNNALRAELERRAGNGKDEKGFNNINYTGEAT